MTKVEVKAMRLSHGLGLPLPQYQTEEAAGLDLLAAVPLTSPMRLLPGTRSLVPTGLTIEIPTGYEGQIRPRSGLALNHGVTVLNSPGTIDADYRGEVKVLLVNLGRETFVITRGQRIAQLVIHSVARADLIDVRSLAASRRGVAGFGSTGVVIAPDAAVLKKAPPPPVPKLAPPAKKPVIKAPPPKPAPPKVAAKPAVKPAAKAVAKPKPDARGAKKVAPPKRPAAGKAKSAARA